MSIAEIKKEIRRALEIPVTNAGEAGSFRVQFPGRPLADPTLRTTYVLCGLGFGGVLITEMGENGREMGDGTWSMSIRTPPDMGLDENDRIAKLLALAYPRGTPLVFGGVSVHVDKVTPGSYGNADDGAWVYGMVVVDWTVYRRP